MAEILIEELWYCAEYAQILEKYASEVERLGVTSEVETLVINVLAELGVLVLCNGTSGQCDGPCPSGQSCIRLHNMNCACSTKFHREGNRIVPNGG